MVVKVLRPFCFCVLLIYSSLAAAYAESEVDKYNQMPLELDYLPLQNKDFHSFFDYWFSTGRHKQESSDEVAQIQVFERWLNLETLNKSFPLQVLPIWSCHHLEILIPMKWPQCSILVLRSISGAPLLINA